MRNRYQVITAVIREKNGVKATNCVCTVNCAFSVFQGNKFPSNKKKNYK